MRVKVAQHLTYAYPDVVVACDDPMFADANLDTILNPTLLVEVLSNSTQDFDRGSKFEHYRQLGSLSEYVVVAENRFHVERFIRQDDNGWLLWETNDPADTIEFKSIDCQVSLAEIYAKVQFDEPTHQESAEPGTK